MIGIPALSEDGQLSALGMTLNREQAEQIRRMAEARGISFGQALQALAENPFGRG
jgi:hypothetical protein